MTIVILGSGNVAFHLAKMFHHNQIPVHQIFGRNEADLREISEKFGIPFSVSALAEANLYLIAVNDDAVAEVSALITDSTCLVAHTSGSLPKEILQGKYRKASFYPLQTFSKNRSINYAEIPFFIETENETDFKLLKDLASAVSGKVMQCDHEKRKYIHLTAVFACNFVNHLYARAKEISDSQEIPFAYFLPLIRETTEKIENLDPKMAQTGPAVRNDQRVLELHEKLLNGREHQIIYKVMNESIKEMYEL